MSGSVSAARLLARSGVAVLWRAAAGGMLGS